MMTTSETVSRQLAARTKLRRPNLVSECHQSGKRSSVSDAKRSIFKGG